MKMALRLTGRSCGVQANLDAIVVPVSGGGMISGIAVAAKQLQPDIKIYAAEPVGKSACITMYGGSFIFLYCLD